MKSFKNKCIKAVDILIADYKEGYHEFDKGSCSLCKIYWKWNGKSDLTTCPGCPNTAFIPRRDETFNLDGRKAGCFLRSSLLSSTPYKYHLMFWREAKKHLLILDPKCFTPRKSQPSDFAGLLKIDRKVYKASPLYTKYKD